MLSVTNLSNSILDISASGGGPGPERTVFSISPSQESSRAVENLTGYTVVSKMQASAFSPTPPTFASQVKILFEASPTVVLNINNVYIGTPPSSGSAWAMTNVTPILFSGLSGASIAADDSLASDWIDFVPASTVILISYNVGATGRMCKIGIPNVTSYVKASSQTASNPGASFTTVSGNFLYCVNSIQVR